jgi:hypothetical protein
MAQTTRGSSKGEKNILIESLRLTAFTGAASAKEITWWSDITGKQPEARTARPPMGFLQETGMFEGRTLILTIQPGRVDWVLNPGPSDVERKSDELSSIGRFPSALSAFVPPMLHWLSLGPPISRLGYGATLLEPAADRVAGYKRLAEFLPTVRIDPAGSEDFLYQINRPRPSALGIANLRINRLSAWSVAAVQKFSVAFAFPQHSLPAQSQLGDILMAVRIGLDISTPANFQGDLPQEALGSILEELVGLASEIALRGDVP